MGLMRIGTAALRVLDPEKAHAASLSLLKAGVHPRYAPDRYPALRTTLAGIDLPNPLGLAAGYDKNAVAVDPLLKMGFGFVEAGAVTPRAQPGNAKPRVFRLPRSEAVINRFGFNNDGLDAIGARLAARAGKRGIVGINLGANKDSDDRTADFVTGLTALVPHVAFCTVNISSPNTPGLRALQDKAALTDLLRQVTSIPRGQTRLFLKIAPDLTDEDKADIASAIAEVPVDALIVSNTTITRPDGLSGPAHETGGLSGRPLFEPATAVLRDFARMQPGMPLIGVGGISSPDDAYTKIRAGASAIQLYTGLIYKGPDLVRDILAGLAERLAADGFNNVGEAVGADL